MTLVQLRHFIALAECASFSRAADVLCLTQPALSRSIRALEDELGQDLVDRTGRSVEVTPFGREVLVHARQLTRAAEGLQESGRLILKGALGRLRLGLGSGPGAMLMTPLLQHMATAHPALHFEIARGSIDLLTLALRERRLDALIVDARSLQPAEDLLVENLGEMRGSFLCRAGHPLLAHEGPVDFEAIARHPVASIALSDEVARTLVERYGPGAHPNALVTLRCDDYASLAEVARHSDAILLAIRAAAPDLVELDVQPPLDSRARFGLVTLAGRSVAPALVQIRSLVDRLLRD